MTETDHKRQGNRGNADAPGGWRRGRGILYTVSVIALLAGVFAGAVACKADATNDSHTFAPPTVLAERIAPAIVASAVPPTDAPMTQAPVSQPETTTVQADPTATAADTATSSATQAPNPTPTLGEAWSATPAVSTPAPASGLSDAALQVAAEIEARWGIDVVTEGQDWGADEALQARNLRWLAEALASLPPGVAAAATHNAHGTLSVLSNRDGRTLSGWQPYGGGAANFYANEDVGPSGRVATNQIILETGASRMTIAHELLHAYQMRNVEPGRYGRALLGDEMRSFMAATGWVAGVPGEQLASSVDGSWETVASLYDYEGVALVYASETGETVHTYTPNPIEAFAVVAALYYAPPDGTDRPDWPTYWGWFDANLR